MKDNLSSSNFAGVNVQGDENTVQGNSVGTDVGGDASLPNVTGIRVLGGDRNLIGGPGEGEGNLVSGNVLRHPALVRRAATRPRTTTSRAT